MHLANTRKIRGLLLFMAVWLCSAQAHLTASEARPLPSSSPVAAEIRLMDEAYKSAQKGDIAAAWTSIADNALAESEEDTDNLVLARLESVCGRLAENGAQKSAKTLLDKAISRPALNGMSKAGGIHLRIEMLRLLWRFQGRSKFLNHALKEALVQNPNSKDLLLLKAELETAEKNFPSAK